jgi:phosphatidylglycerophosphatase A
MTRLALTLATFFGCGYFPFGPGTVGSLAALAIAVLFHHFWGIERLGILAAVLLLLLPAIWSATQTERIVEKEDPGIVVVDEVLGQWLALAGATVWNWKTYLAAFALFRLFDIWKPQPVRAAEALPGGTGIVTDDLVAGLYAALILYMSSYLRLY